MKDIYISTPQCLEPLVNDSEEILGEAACNFIDTEYAWYQRYFGYIS